MFRSSRSTSTLSHRVALAAVALGVLAPLAVAAQVTRPRPQPPREPQDRRPMTPTPAPSLQSLDSLAFSGVRWREVGPYRGGRSVIATGSASRPKEYYMGTVGGGVDKSVDGGDAWFPVTDKYFGGTIGAIAVAPSNPDVVYVGGGEYPIRGNVSHGDDAWKTSDERKTWQ